MSSYSFQGTSRVWIPRDEEENRAIFSARKQETGIKMPVAFKPVYLANAEFEVEKWSLKKLTQLLRLYGAHRCLWDLRDPGNRNRKLRKAALIDITAAMGGLVTRRQVVQKINILRATYRYEKRRIKQRIRKGIGAKTKLKWFALVDAFLRNVPRTEKYRKNEDANTDSDLEDAIVFTIDPETLIPLDEEEEEKKDEEQVDEKECDLHDELIQHDFIKIEEDDCPTEKYECIDQHIANARFKNEKLPTIKAEQYRETASSSAASKQIWTATESLQFVHLLSEHPILFNEEYNESKEQMYAIKQIANTMQINEQRIEKRVYTFRRTYAQEQVKCAQNQNYSPSFVWWTEAESFMESNRNNTQIETATYFIDTNDELPATPMNMESQMHIKQESDEFQQPTPSLSTPINPIPSVAPPSICNEEMEEAFEALFTSNSIGTPNYESTSLSLASKKTIKAENDIDAFIAESTDPSLAAASPASQLPAAPLQVNDVDKPAKPINDSGTKLIWNGLEDDLLEGKWSLKHSVKFLRLYGAHRCLWDLNDPDYRSRELRNAAIEDIAAAMGYNLNADYVAKKIKIFRITYMQHRKRMLEAIKEGKEPEIQLRWFPLADSFLRPHIGLRCIKERECEMPQFDLQYVYANLNLIDPALLTDFRGKGTQNQIEIGGSGAQESVQNGEEQKVDVFVNNINEHA